MNINQKNESFSFVANEELNDFTKIIIFIFPASSLFPFLE